MPTGIFDIRDRAEVEHPSEIAAAAAQCRADNVTHIGQLGGPDVRLEDYVEMLQERWRRACMTAQVIEFIHNGYCSITPLTTPASSDARH